MSGFQKYSSVIVKMLRLFIFLMLILCIKSQLCPSVLKCTCEYNKLICPNFQIRYYKNTNVSELHCQQNNHSSDNFTFETGNFKLLNYLRFIDCSGVTGHTIIKIILKTATSIKKLDFSKNQISHLERRIFKNYSDLNLLLLQRNQLELVDNQFIHLTKLKYLDLGYNNLSILRKDMFAGLDKLKYLLLNNNDIKTISDDVFFFKNLVRLDLTNNKLYYLPNDVFNNLVNLSYVAFSNTRFDDQNSLPEELFTKNNKLTKLIWFNNFGKKCDLKSGSGCNSSFLHFPPDLIKNHTKLKYLYFSNLGFKTISSEFLFGLVNLLNLTIKSVKEKNRGLSHLPETLFRDTKKIIFIDLSGNEFNELPENIFYGLFQLKTLKLQHNELTFISASLFKNVINLQQLYVNNNKLNFIEPNAFQYNKKLQYVNISHNNLISILPHPAYTYWSHVGSLQTLDLSFNRINLSRFPDDLRLSKRQFRLLDLSHNEIGPILRAEELQFGGIPGKFILNLKFNKIERFDLNYDSPLHVEENDLRNHIIIIGNNPLKCDCEAENLVNYTRGKLNSIVTKWFLLDVNNLHCESPNDLKGILVKDIDSSDLLCNKKESCPQNCLCYLNRIKRETVMKCADLPVGVKKDIPLYLGSDSISLVLAKNKIRNICSFLKRNFKNLEMVTRLDFSQNFVTNLHHECLPKTLQGLNISHNNLTSLNLLEIKFLRNILNNSYGNYDIDLGSNPWSCECNVRYMFEFIHENINNDDFGKPKMLCKEGWKLIQEVTIDKICHNLLSVNIIVVILISILIITFVTAIIVSFCACNRAKIVVWIYSREWGKYFFSESDLDKDKLYDVFISYSHHDEKFVEESLIVKLENEEPKYICHYHTRDWNAGDLIEDQIIESISASKRTLLILSKNFIESNWSMHEFKFAHMQAFQDKSNRVIMIVRGELPPLTEMDDMLRSYVTSKTYLSYDDPWFWEKLRYALPHKGKGRKGRVREFSTRSNPEKVELMLSESNKKCANDVNL